MPSRFNVDAHYRNLVDRAVVFACRLDGLDILHDINATRNTTEYGVLSIEPRSRLRRDEPL